MKNIYELVDILVYYGIRKGLINDEDRWYAINKLMFILKLDEFHRTDSVYEENKFKVSDLLEEILDWAYENRVITDNGIVSRDMLDSLIMDALMSKPSEIINNFYKKLENNKKEATRYFYDLACNSNYIRQDRIDKNQKWVTRTNFGELDITINLSKPEKDPKIIAKLLNTKSLDYPKCMLCRENEGYYGRMNYPARSNHRIIPIKLNNENWFFQYSPYVYYNEHCIVLNEKHTPMKICRDTLVRLFDFVKILPHYFIGSNADLPIVGGSILDHDHFQGGNYEFAMAKAAVELSFKISGYEDVSLNIVKWPMSVIRLIGKDSYQIINLAMHVYENWQKYSDESLEIVAFTKGISHNTITPIARKKKDNFELDIVLRNNRTSKEHQYGIFHPHDDVHHIKKENIGLIEVMGLAVLPARLKLEIEKIKSCIVNKKSLSEFAKDANLCKHLNWYKYLREKYYEKDHDDLDNILQYEIGLKFLQVLKDAAVFKDDKNGRDGFIRFIQSL